MKTVIGVKFKDGGKMYYFDPGELAVKEGDGVIVETARGTEFGDVVAAPQEVEDDKIIAPLKSVVRVATAHDREQRDKNRARESEAYAICMEKIQAHKLEMKLVDVEYTFNGSKVVFYFTADGRVDFRELVKDLASVFKTRIELRQIGVRDEAKMLGGSAPAAARSAARHSFRISHPFPSRWQRNRTSPSPPRRSPASAAGSCVA